MCIQKINHYNIYSHIIVTREFNNISLKRCGCLSVTKYIQWHLNSGNGIKCAIQVSYNNNLKCGYLKHISLVCQSRWNNRLCRWPRWCPNTTKNTRPSNRPSRFVERNIESRCWSSPINIYKHTHTHII